MKNLLRNFTLVAISFLAFSCADEENKNLPSTSIAKIIAVTPEFSSLKEALDITGLTSTFEEAGDYTVFVPTNDAFDAVLGGLTVEEFDTANPGVLEAVLKYHVLGARVLSTDLTNGQEAATLQGQNITISLVPNIYYPELDPDLGTYEEKSIFINGSRVFARDAKCSNGIIHVIDAVLLPAIAG
ncbi:fasciclin domain-containing protein [Flavobacterium paronense]|uniref:Fasciclin domain-containing protein n=1 Tax=Flavobacterium paronense TaxID=1392775 RepID=A0ABV5GHF1_9FLAO|nr:fasciclin domain-containing protein [Flavobacterium paronense]MDN3676536.1 fasciclin domain-containing protein [Flavobacterium paronense]